MYYKYVQTKEKPYGEQNNDLMEVVYGNRDFNDKV